MLTNVHITLKDNQHKDKMKPNVPKMQVVDFAYQVIDMQRKIEHQEYQINRLLQVEQDYNDLLNSSMNHSRKMMDNMLTLCLTQGVTETLLMNGKPEDFKQ
jgi:hypothetical protein